MKKPAHEKAKREELQTYRDLGLKRLTKSKKRYGMTCVIGEGTADKPRLRVPFAQYQETRLEVMREILEEAKKAGTKLNAAAIYEMNKNRTEALIYERMVTKIQKEKVFDGALLRSEGRKMTPEEKKILLSGEKNSVIQSASVSRQGMIMDGLLQKIEERQKHSPAKYRAAWAEAVGPEHAMASQLDRYEPETATIYFKCFNSVLSHYLQQQKELPVTLSKILKVAVRRVKPAYN